MGGGKKQIGSIPVQADPGTDPVEAGPVAQGIRARGYEPRCRGFESLLARNQSSSKGISLLSRLGLGWYLAFSLGRSRRGEYAEAEYSSISIGDGAIYSPTAR